MQGIIRESEKCQTAEKSGRLRVDNFHTMCAKITSSQTASKVRFASLNFAGKKFLKRGSVWTILGTTCVDKRTGFADRQKKKRQHVSQEMTSCQICPKRLDGRG